jgi:CBS domain-containing protein
MAEGMNYCPNCGASTKKTSREVYTVSSDDLVKKVKDLIHEGNITKIIVKNEKDETLLEIPVTVGVIGAILLPWMAALGVIAAMVTQCKIIVERQEK